MGQATLSIFFVKSFKMNKKIRVWLIAQKGKSLFLSLIKQGLTTEELYRMIELLDLVKAGRDDKMTPEDLKMLEFLMGQYQQ